MTDIKKAPFEGLQKYDAKQLFSNLPTPSYVVDEAMLRRNGEILKGVQTRTGCKILLAQKAFSNYDAYPMMSQYLAGTEASGLYEARLGKEEMPQGEIHVFCTAYKDSEFDELLTYADHIVFNSPAQLQKFGKKAKRAGKSVGIRINPEHSTQEGHEIYDPCSEESRLGTTLAQWKTDMTDELYSLLDGIHFHTLCEQNADALEETLAAVCESFGDFLYDMNWINFGGGHHITRVDYDLATLEKCISNISGKYDLTVYLEPGEACALNAGYLITEILDITEKNGLNIAIVDTSASCHMPDVIEMPYLPPLMNTAEEGMTYILGGPSCLAGDVIGKYTFNKPLNVGELLIFGDMAIYSMCKNNTFNGMPLPDIYVLRENGTLENIRHFCYEDFKYRLGTKKNRQTQE